MDKAKEIHFPFYTTQQHAQAMLEHLNNACPFSTTFLFMEPGCESVGQGTALAKAIENAMRESFQRWADSWMRPHVSDLINKVP